MFLKFFLFFRGGERDTERENPKLGMEPDTGLNLDPMTLGS